MTPSEQDPPAVTAAEPPPAGGGAGVRLAVLVAEATIGRCLAKDGHLSARELSVDLRHAAARLAARRSVRP